MDGCVYGCMCGYEVSHTIIIIFIVMALQVTEYSTKSGKFPFGGVRGRTPLFTPLPSPLRVTVLLS